MSGDGVIVCGYRVADDGHVYCGCCGDDLGAPDSWHADEWPVTPGGFCWACGLGYCPPECPNAPEPVNDGSLAHDDLDYDLAARLADPCPECGATGACGWDSEGRALIHASPSRGGHGEGER